MKHIVRKPYWNFEREENWLNNMSAKGLALVDYSWCRYVFEDSDPGEYIYRLELLKDVPDNIESKKYIEFLEQTGVEHVASYMKWVYFRKKSSEGKFDIYSDIDSRIDHYKRVLVFFAGLTLLEYAAATANIIIGLSHLFLESGFNLNLYLGCLVFILGLVFSVMMLKIAKKLKLLWKEKAIRE